MEMKNWSEKGQESEVLKNRLNLMEMEERSRPDEVKMLQEIWLVIASLPVSLHDSKEIKGVDGRENDGGAESETG